MKTRPITHVALALDYSSSMMGIREQTRSAVNQMMATLRDRARQGDQDIFVSVVSFADTARVVAFPQDARNLRELDGYAPYGNTALFDGVGLAAETIAGKGGPEASYLVLAFTDGEENYSLKYNAFRVAALIKERQGEGNWTFAFQVPRGGYAQRLVSQFGIPAENVREWEQTTQGVKEMEQKTSAGLAQFFDVRGQGARSVANFYDLTTNLAGLSKKRVKSELDDVSARFKAYSVTAEVAVKDFVEQKTKKPYVVGAAYYQLMKPEKVQPTKAVLIMEKGKTAVWGGDDARELIGLPTDGVSHAKVTPGNHSDYDIYIQSTSVNRKLPRGTKVLVDVTMTAGLTETWDSKAAEEAALAKKAEREAVERAAAAEAEQKRTKKPARSKK